MRPLVLIHSTVMRHLHRIGGTPVIASLIIGVVAASALAGPATAPATPAARVRAAFRDLKDPKLPAAQKTQRVYDILDDLGAALPAVKDPAELMQDAKLLFDAGVARDANALEYWGDAPVLEGRIERRVEAVLLMLDKAWHQAAAEAAAIKPKLNLNNQATLGDKYDKLDLQAHVAEYSLIMHSYYRALATPAGKRPRVVSEIVEALRPYDNANSGVMPAVRLMMGKLN